MTGPPIACPRCAAAVTRTDRFCESCGAALSELRRISVPGPAGTPGANQGPCADCGNDTFVEEYCTACGHRRAEPDRSAADLDAIVLVSDRGLVHVGNEDAAAAGTVAVSAGLPPYAIAVAVCDGVSTSGQAHMAAAAAAAAGVDAMLAALAASGKGRPAALTGLAEATRAAAAAGTNSDASSSPSCTYTAAAIAPAADGTAQITIANVGDSRAYWLPAGPEPARQLTVDDSLAQELITAGVSADSDAVQRSAHTLTRWLGADAGSKPWSDSSVHTITATGPGSLLLCTDGLWNYLPEADDIARLCTGADAAAVATALVDFALQAGGHDNVTVAVIPIGGPHEFS